MGFATHLGPWLLGTVKDTTGTTAGTVRNTGSTIVCQTKTIAFGDSTAATAFALPAGALITAIQLITTTAFSGGTSPTVACSIGATAITNGVSLGAVGVTAATLGAVSATAAGLVANVGTTDVLVTYAVSGAPTAGAGTLVIAYTVRGADGVGYPVGNQN